MTNGDQSARLRLKSVVALQLRADGLPLLVGYDVAAHLFYVERYAVEGYRAVRLFAGRYQLVATYLDGYRMGAKGTP